MFQNMRSNLIGPEFVKIIQRKVVTLKPDVSCRTSIPSTLVHCCTFLTHCYASKQSKSFLVSWGEWPFITFYCYIASILRYVLYIVYGQQTTNDNEATTATTPTSKKTHFFFFPPLRQKLKRKRKRDTVFETQVGSTTGMNRLWPLLQQKRESELGLQQCGPFYSRKGSLNWDCGSDFRKSQSAPTAKSLK